MPKEAKRERCPECTKAGRDSSGDNLVLFADGGAHCFACGHHRHGDGSTQEKAKAGSKLTKPLIGKVLALDHRKIDLRTCRLFDYRMAKNGDKVVEIANYYKNGTCVAQHLRYPGKEFRWRGDTEDLPFFGQWLFSGGGKRIVVTEGELDAMSVSMIQRNRWPVVSVPNGVNHAPKAIKTNFEFLAGYEEIILCFDNDEPGRKAAEECAALLPPGKVRIAVTPRKDANEHVMANETAIILNALTEARSYQPDGILHVGDVVSDDGPNQDVWLFPWDCLTESLMGQRSGEMTLWASGSGSGKSSLIRELALDHLISGRKVGLLMLEESPSETLDDMVGLLLKKPVRQIRAGRTLNAMRIKARKPALNFRYVDNLTDEDYEAARSALKEMPLYIYDHRGSNAFDNILSRVEYMAGALGCDVVMMDHITAVIVGMDHGMSEREGIDDVMRQLRSIVERTGVHLDVVSQLNRLEGKAAEEGGQISMKNLRGSGSLGSVPNNVIAVERNQQSIIPDDRNVMKIRVLKGRFTGLTGIAGYLKMDTDTRRLVQTEYSETEGQTFKENDNVGTESPDPAEEPNLAGLEQPEAEPAPAHSALADLFTE